MKRGDIVVPTWGRRERREAKLQHKDIGIIVATRPANANKYDLISVKVAIVRAAAWPIEEPFIPKWYHCTHWQKVNNPVKEE